MLIAVAILVAIGVTVSMLLAGVLFAISFIILAAVRPGLAFMFILGASPFVWDVGGGPVKMAVSEIALVLLWGVCIATGHIKRVANPLWLPIGVYLVVCVASIFVNGPIEGTAASLVQMLLYFVVAVHVFSAGIQKTDQVFPALYAMIGSSLALVLMLFLTGSNYAFGLHKNNTGSSIGLGLAVAIALWFGESNRRMKQLLLASIVILLCGLVFSLSRGSWMGAVCGTLVMLFLRRQWKLALRVALVAVPVVAIVWMLLPNDSKEVATAVGADVYTTKARLISIEYGLAQFQQSPIIGVGTGLRKNYDATNVFITVLAETGVLGMISFFSIFIVFALMTWRTAKRLRPGDPAMILLSIGAAMMTDKLVHGMVDHYWVRGMLPVWAGAGLVVYAWNQSRRLTKPSFARLESD